VAKTCIICAGRAGSREHIFPAVLGGRRVNKGIYCGTHNNAFSPLAAILSRQLTAINAALDVRPDHSDEPHKLKAINPSDGQEYLMSALDAEMAAPRVVKDVEVDGVRHVEAHFANERQIQEWVAGQRASGSKIEIRRRETVIGYFARPYNVELELGGLDGLRAIGYIALTFLAHYFPAIARQPELRSFKDFVLAINEEQSVWWDFSALPNDIPPNSFRFGHRILIGLSASRQEAYARVSLFSTVDFSVHFGLARVDADQTVIVDIDPLADRPPHDINERREQRSLAGVSQPASLSSSLKEAIENGAGRERFERLFGRIFDWQMECVAKELLPQIDATKALVAHERLHGVTQLLRRRGQVILNLMLHVVAGLKQQLGANPSTAAVVPAIEILIAEDPSSATGLSQTALCALELAATALAARICRDDTDGKLDLKRLSLLLGGGLGAEIVGRAILDPVMMHLRSLNTGIDR
jgi:hypothetical protein